MSLRAGRHPGSMRDSDVPARLWLGGKPATDRCDGTMVASGECE